MRARLVVFPIRGRNWCFSRSIDQSTLDSQSAQTPSTFSEFWKEISSSSHNKSTDSKAELIIDFASNKVNTRSSDILSNYMYLCARMNRAWTGLEKAPPGSFKNKLYGLGLRLLARIKPSEIFLKSISKEVGEVEVTFPTSLNARLARRRLRHIALRGTVIHKRYFYGSVSLLPLTAAFAVLPLPNIPFFWMLFRTYSHWRALKGSERLLQLVSDSLETQDSSNATPSMGKNARDDSEDRSQNPLGPSWAAKASFFHSDLPGLFHKKSTSRENRQICREQSMAHEPEDDIKDEKNPRPLDEDDIALLKTYGLGPYSTSIKKAEKEIKEMAKKVNDLCGIKESDTGLAAPSQWDLVSDKQMMQEEQPLQVARCTKIISPNTEDAKYVINVKQIAKFVVGLGDKVSPTDIEEGMRVGKTRCVTYNDVGGCKEQIEKMREVVELPMLHPEKFVKLGIDPPKGVLCYGPPGTGKTLLARAVANRTDACFIRVIGSELVQKYVGEGARMVLDAIGGARFDDGVGGDNEVQRTMLEIVNQLDGFDARGNIKVLMATNRPDTLDPALLRPGRLDRKVEFGLPDLESRTQIFKIHTRTMNCERDIRFELLARLCPNSTGADIRSVCTEAGMYAIRARRKTVTEKDFLDAVNKVIKGYQKFSATPKYMVYN
ncbi:regulatory particle triple-A 1A [Actinidia rufa]|uniref:Regulatory particle triple-A 1A n=1 Tax=Actinidia rufa TaxID=165716 RepID=A0A7J0FH77_9ERIC|nr:regulatory particle triple-A 1A [Actinidia rufa]